MKTRFSFHTSFFRPFASMIASWLLVAGAALLTVQPSAGGQFIQAGDIIPRVDHRALLLRDGKVLVMGGQGEHFGTTAGAELYDPATRTWGPTGSMTSPRRAFIATLLS